MVRFPFHRGGARPSVALADDPSGRPQKGPKLSIENFYSPDVGPFPPGRGTDFRFRGLAWLVWRQELAEIRTGGGPSNHRRGTRQAQAA